jgi:outer membrane immunogenic protein
MKKLFLGSMALAALIAGPAMAADMPVKALPPPPVVYDWSGVYVGFNIGGAWYDVERTYPNIGGASIKSSGSDGIYGFHAGAQGQWGSWVLGIEAAFSGCFRECQSSAVIFALPSPPAPAGATFDAFNKITNLFTVGPRLGYAWDRWMIYGTGGYATGTVHGQYRAAGLQVFPGGAGFLGTNLSGHSWNDGWFAGGGLEFMVHKGALVDVILGAEYQHIDLRSRNAFTNAALGNVFDFNHDAVVDVVRARLTIKTQGWGWAGPYGGPVVAKK